MPSRGRSLEANLEATIAGLQRSGSALPRLVTANNTEEHLTRASQADPYHSALMARVTTGLWKSLRHTLDKYDTLQQSREHKLSELKTLAEQLEGKRVEWSQQLEAAIRPVVGHLHLPLLSALADRNGIDCKTILSAISEGSRLTGEAPEAGNLAWKQKLATNPPITSPSQIRDINLKTLARAQIQGEKAEHCWTKTLEEVMAGFIDDFHQIPEGEVPEDAVLTPRFVVEQHTGQGETKWRIIDDYAVSGVNDRLTQYDTYKPQPLDTLMTIARAWRLSGYRPERHGPLKMWTMDVKAAFKGLAVSPEDSLETNVVVGNPFTKTKWRGRMRAIPFGSSRSPAAWGQVAVLIQDLIFREFGVPLLCFVDDFYEIGPDSEATSAYRVSREMFKLLNIPVALEKVQEPNTSVYLLGASIQASETAIYSAVSSKRKGDLVNQLANILERGTLTRGQAAKLRGKLQFSTSLIQGRWGRAFLTTLANHQYRGDSKEITSQLRADLGLWVKMLISALPRKMPLDPGRPLILYGDACGAGHLGGVMILPEGIYKCQYHLPLFTAPWHISLKEAAASLMVASAAFTLHTKNAPVVLFTDNTATLGALVRGNAEDETLLCLVRATERYMMEYHAMPWYEYVPSACNPADAPSRDCPWVTEKAGAPACEMVENAILTGPTTAFAKMLAHPSVLKDFAEHRRSLDEIEQSGPDTGANAQTMCHESPEHHGPTRLLIRRDMGSAPT